MIGDFAFMPSSPVLYPETQDETTGYEIKEEPRSGIVRPADIFPYEVPQAAANTCLIYHSFQHPPAPTVNEVLMPDNFTITDQTPTKTEILQEVFSSDSFSSFAMSYDLNQSIVFTSDDYRCCSSEQKTWQAKGYVHEGIAEIKFAETRQHFKTESEQDLAEAENENGSVELGPIYQVEPEYQAEPMYQVKPEHIEFMGVLDEDEKPTKESLMVVIKLRRKKEFLHVLEKSGPDREYNLPIFRTLQPLNMMKNCAKYRSSKEIPSHSEVLVTSVGSRHHVIIKRYDSRLTLGQLALVLGLQKYKVTLVKDIESAVVAMFDQLCGFRIGQGTWCRGIPRIERQDMISRVFEFAKIYFPSFSKDTIQIIIKRGAYSRTQEFLRRERRRKARYHI